MISTIKPVFFSKVPKEYINDVNGWAFSESVIKKNIGKLLTLDIDFGKKCSLNCPHCFRKNNLMNKYSHNSNNMECKDLSFSELKKQLYEAKALGLRSVKFLGKGEPFECENLIELLEYLNELNVIPLIFTKGHVIGDDVLAQRYFYNYGINNGKQLAQKMLELNTSILLGFNSFDKEVQNRMVGDVGEIFCNGKTYYDVKNRALEILVDEGFNQSNPTRLCLATNPATNDNIHGIFDIYKWGRDRNMYVIVTPSMISGRARRHFYWKNITPPVEKLVELYTRIYIYNIEIGIQSLEQVKREGISGYAGGHPCNQISTGMYLTINGKVFRCPGDEVTYFGNVRKNSIKEIWEKSENYGRSGQFNCKCPPKWEKSIPVNLFTQVMMNINSHFRENNG